MLLATGFLAAVGGGGAGREGPGRPLTFLPSGACRFVRVGGVGLLELRGGSCTSNERVRNFVHNVGIRLVKGN